MAHDNSNLIETIVEVAADEQVERRESPPERNQSYARRHMTLRCGNVPEADNVRQSPWDQSLKSNFDKNLGE